MPRSELLNRFSVDDAIDYLLPWTTKYSSTQSNVKGLTCSIASAVDTHDEVNVLSHIADENDTPVHNNKHAKRIIDLSLDTTLERSRSNVWRQAKGFYTSCLHDSSLHHLRKNGALKNYLKAIL